MLPLMPPGSGTEGVLVVEGTPPTAWCSTPLRSWWRHAGSSVHISNYSALCGFAPFPSLQYTRWTARPMVWVCLWDCHHQHRGSSRPVRCRYDHPRRPSLPRSASPVIHRTLPGSVLYPWWCAALVALVPWTRWGSSGRARLSADCLPRTPPAQRRALRSAITRGGRRLHRPPSLGWSLRPRLDRCSATFSHTRTMAGTFGPRGSVRDHPARASCSWCRSVFALLRVVLLEPSI